MALSNAGIRVRLKIANEDYSGPKKFWFFISPSFSSISDLVQSIKEKQKMYNREVLLFLEDALLPDYEVIQIIRDGDLITVRCQDANEVVNTNQDSFCEEEQPRKKKRRKEKDEESVSEKTPVVVNSSVQEKKKKKFRSVECEEAGNESFVPDESSFPLVNEKVTRKGSTIQEDVPSQLEIAVLQDGNGSVGAEDSNLSFNEEGKRKRRRRRHHKKKVAELDLVVECPIMSPIIAHPVISKGAKGTHTKFDEHVSLPTPAAETFLPLSSSKPVTDAVPRNPKPVAETATPISKATRETVAPAFQDTRAPLSIPAPPRTWDSYNNQNTQNAQGSHSLFEALTSLQSAVFVRTPAVPKRSIPPPTETDLSKDSNGDEFQPEKYQLLTSQPRQGDIIAFKILELGDNYTPQISDYFLADVTSVSPFGDITMNLKKRPKENRNKNGKFELIWEEDENPEAAEETLSNTVTYQWSELIEPRLIVL